MALRKFEREITVSAQKVLLSFTKLYTTCWKKRKTRCTFLNAGLLDLWFSPKVTQIYFSYVTEKTNYGCHNPCSIFSFTTIQPKKNDDDSVYITFPRYVKVFERSYTYSPLSLVAEVGGYVGLFLGISINQVTHLLDFLLRMIKRILQILGHYY